MKKKTIIVIVAVIIVAGIVTAIVIVGNRHRTAGLNPANPGSTIDISDSIRGTLVVSTETASPGDEVEVAVSVKNNPGILGMTLSVNYVTGALTLTDAKSGDAIKEALTFTKPGTFQNNCKFLWDGMELSDDMIKDGDVLILTFKVNDNAEPGNYPILLSYEQDGIVDRGLSTIDLDIIDGSLTVE